MSDPIPSSLTVYLSNACNLSCSYCYVAVNQGPAAALDFSRLREGVDYFLARAPREGRKISLLGGEPLRDFPLLRHVVEHIRTEAAPTLPVHLFTNGLLLDAERLAFLGDHDVDVTVGFGGGAVAMSAPVRAALRAPTPRLGASVVVTPASVGTFLGHVDFLYRAGLRRISFSPDVRALWTEQDAMRLRAALTGLRHYYGALIRNGAELFEVANIYEALAQTLGGRDEGAFPCDRLILAADGRFYACDKLFGAPLDDIASLSVGSPRSELDAPRRLAFIQEALDAARDILGPSSGVGCPAGVHSLWRVGADRSAQGLRERMRSFGRVSQMVRGGLLDLANEFKENEVFRRTHHLLRQPDS